MIHLNRFTVTDSWQELTGVSGEANTFKITNDSNNIMLISASPTEPVDNFEPFYQKETKIIENTNSDKIWIKCRVSGAIGKACILQAGA